MTKEKEENSLAIRRFDIEKIENMNGMADVLKTFIVKQKLFTNIKGKNYAHVEGWQVAGGMLGLYPRVVKVEDLSKEKEIKWRADVEIIERSTGNVVSNGFAVCSNLEKNKKDNDEYAILSMAQTRAIGKAYRNLVGWVMKLAGYEATPQEEMPTINVSGKNAEVPQKPTNLKSQIMFLLKKLGITDKTKIAKEVKRLTKLDVEKEENLNEIKDRLEVLVMEMENESN